MAPNSEVESQCDHICSDKYHRPPIEGLCVDISLRWESKKDDQEDVVDEGYRVRDSSSSTKIPSCNVHAVPAGKPSPKGATVCEGVRGVESYELSGDDCIESYDRAEVDADQEKGDDAGDVDRVSRRVGWMCDLENQNPLM